MRSLDYARRYSQVELLTMQAVLCGDPRSRETMPGSIYLYKKAVRKKLDDIAWALAFQMGNPATHPQQEGVKREPVYGGYGDMGVPELKRFKEVTNLFNKAFAAGLRA